MASDPVVPSVRASGRRLGPAVPDEPAWSGDFTFVQAADTQFGLIGRYIDRADPPAGSAKEIHLARRLVREVNALSPTPRFLIVCGDMVDAFPGRGAESTEARRVQLGEFASCFRRLRPDVPLVCVCGNHDMGDQPTPDTVSAYRDAWGEDYFEFWIGGCQMLVVNSQFYVDSSRVPDERANMHAWLLDRLRRGSPPHRLVFMHVPPFLADAEADADGYFNLPRAERLPLLAALDDAGVSVVFCGHYHQNAGGLYRGRMPVVITSAVGAQIGQDRHGYRLVTVARDAVRHRYVEFDCPVNLPGGACDVCVDGDDAE